MLCVLNLLKTLSPLADSSNIFFFGTSLRPGNLSSCLRYNISAIPSIMGTSYSRRLLISTSLSNALQKISLSDFYSEVITCRISTSFFLPWKYHFQLNSFPVLVSLTHLSHSSCEYYLPGQLLFVLKPKSYLFQ